MKKNYDVIIIGAGIAGMTAALYLKRYNMDVLIIEKEYPGGQLNKIAKIENYPGFLEINGFDLGNNIYEQIKKLEIPIIFEKVEKIKNETDKKLVETTNEIYEANYIVIATGRLPRKLNIEIEDELIGKGISYCATCDGPLYKNKDVIVVGGGDSALQEALYLSSICNKVTLIHRRDSFRAREELVEKVKNKENIEIIYNSVINTLIQENERFFGIKIDKNGEILEKKADGLFIYIGNIVDENPFSMLSLHTKDRYIIVNEKYETNIPNIYACGDVILKDSYQLTTAVGDAATLAYSLHKNYIDTKKPM